MTKVCPKCDSEKAKTDFYKNRASYDGVSSHCKICQNVAAKERYKRNPEKYKQAQKARMQNPEYREAYREWKNNYNKTIGAESLKKWKLDNKEHINRQARERRLTDINYKIACNLRSRVRTALRRGQKAGSAIKQLGCSVSELKVYIESKFEPGMTWANYGYQGWHIDHIKPLSSFDLTDLGQFKEACHYTNLQPLWKVDNLRKSDKL
jgi:hypothetical protein